MCDALAGWSSGPAAAQMLAALGDGTRFKILLQSFAFGAQATVESIFVPSPKGGTIASGIQPFCKELRDRRPDLLRVEDKKVETVRIQTMQFPGDKIPGPSTGTLSFVASFNFGDEGGGKNGDVETGAGDPKRMKWRLVRFV